MRAKVNKETRIKFGRRLHLYRTINCWSMQDVVDRLEVKVSTMSISKYENGKAYPTTAIMSALCILMGMESEELSHPFGEPVIGLEFRKDAVISAKKLKSIEKILQSHIEQYVELMNECGIIVHPFNTEKIVISKEEDIIRAADHYRQLWGVENGCAHLLRTLEDMGIIVYDIKEPKEEFDGISGTAGVYTFIALRKNLNSEQKRFTALHELAHLIFDFDAKLRQSKIEKLCQLFAQEMLLPAQRLKELLASSNSRKHALVEFAKIQREYGISIDNMVECSYSNKLISKDSRDTYHEKKRRIQEFRQFAVKSRFTEETCERYRETVLKGYTSGLLTEEKAAYYLGLQTVTFVDRYNLF